MFDRKLFKAKGKKAFQANYWTSVLVAFFVQLPVWFTTVCTFTSTANESLVSTASTQDASGAVTTVTTAVVSNPMFGAFAALAGFIVAASLGIQIFVSNPLELSGARFFLMNSESTADISEMKYGFTPNYLHKVRVLLGVFIRTFLWSLLFIIPGIIKAYEYRLVPYLLSQNDALTTNEAIAASRNIMNGNKWKAFVMDLSFIGWDLLSGFTGGLLSIFFVSPYKMAASAEMYKGLLETVEAN